jgi:hypothetical protein
MSLSVPPRVALRLATGLIVTLAGCGDSPVDPGQKVASIQISPRTAQLYAVDQEVSFSASVTTEDGTAGDGVEVSFISRDPSLVSVSSLGVATAVKKGGATWVVAQAGGKSDSARVEVSATTCGSVTPTKLDVGQVVSGFRSGFCASGADAQYVVIVHNNTLASTGSSNVEVTGIAVTAPQAPSLASSVNARASLSVAGGFALRRRDVEAEMRHRRNEAATVAPLVDAARAWYASRPRRASLNAAPPAVGDVMSINVNIGSGNGCTDERKDISARVAAVSSSAIVLDDPGNPRGDGYTDAEYARFAEVFDSVIFPLDTTQFGAPTDLDGNGRVLLVFTRSVNQLTSAGGDSYVGGLTHSRDLLPAALCPGSNAAEMFYLLVPDSLGVVNGNTLFAKSFVNQVTDATIAHEFQHLINFARRRYVVPGAAASEELWLNEGLSHVAEELLYYRITGGSPRSNIGFDAVASSSAFDSFLSYFAGDFLNYDEFAAMTTRTSPFASGDALNTRGATWSFLRYSVDQKMASDGRVWYDFVNKGDAGRTNMQNRLGVDAAGLAALLRDFQVAIYADDFVAGVDSRYTQPSWNMRGIYPGLRHADQSPFEWPLQGTTLANGSVNSATLSAGGFAVYRFGGVEGADSFIRVTGTAASALPSAITVSVIRTR